MTATIPPHRTAAEIEPGTDPAGFAWEQSDAHVAILRGNVDHRWAHAENLVENRATALIRRDLVVDSQRQGTLPIIVGQLSGRTYVEVADLIYEELHFHHFRPDSPLCRNGRVTEADDIPLEELKKDLPGALKKLAEKAALERIELVMPGFDELTHAAQGWLIYDLGIEPDSPLFLKLGIQEQSLAPDGTQDALTEFFHLQNTEDEPLSRGFERKEEEPKIKAPFKFVFPVAETEKLLNTAGSVAVAAGTEFFKKSKAEQKTKQTDDETKDEFPLKGMPLKHLKVELTQGDGEIKSTTQIGIDMGPIIDALKSLTDNKALQMSINGLNLLRPLLSNLKTEVIMRNNPHSKSGIELELVLNPILHKILDAGIKIVDALKPKDGKEAGVQFEPADIALMGVDPSELAKSPEGIQKLFAALPDMLVALSSTPDSPFNISRLQVVPGGLEVQGQIAVPEKQDEFSAQADATPADSAGFMITQDMIKAETQKTASSQDGQPNISIECADDNATLSLKDGDAESMNVVVSNDDASPFGVRVASIHIDSDALQKATGPNFPIKAVEAAQTEYDIPALINAWLFPLGVLGLNLNLRTTEVTGFAISRNGILLKTRKK